MQRVGLLVATVLMSSWLLEGCAGGRQVVVRRPAEELLQEELDAEVGSQSSRQAVDDLQGKLAAVENEKAQLLYQLIVFTTNAKEQQRQVAHLQVGEKALKDELERAQRTLEDTQRGFEELKEDASAQTVSELEKKVAFLQQENAELNEKLTEVRKELQGAGNKSRAEPVAEVAKRKESSADVASGRPGEKTTSAGGARSSEAGELAGAAVAAEGQDAGKKKSSAGTKKKPMKKKKKRKMAAAPAPSGFFGFSTNTLLVGGGAVVVVGVGIFALQRRKKKAESKRSKKKKPAPGWRERKAQATKSQPPPPSAPDVSKTEAPPVDTEPAATESQDASAEETEETGSREKLSSEETDDLKQQALEVFEELVTQNISIGAESKAEKTSEAENRPVS